MSDLDWAFLAFGGFLLGSVFYTGYYTTRYEPEAKPGYAFIGLGIFISVSINTWLDFSRDTSNWFRTGTVIGYFIIAIGLVLLVRERRGRQYGPEIRNDSGNSGNGDSSPASSKSDS